MRQYLDEVVNIIGQPENEKLEYKAVLPPARVIARHIAGFANSEGGYIVLGVVESPAGLKVNGFSADSNANSIVHKAYDSLQPKPEIDYGFVTHLGKRLFVIYTKKSPEKILFEGKLFVRRNDETISDEQMVQVSRGAAQEVRNFSQKLNGFKTNCTDSKVKYLDHYLSVLKLVDDLAPTLYPNGIHVPTTISEGKLLARILFSSCVDNFETYLTDLLFEIYLAQPSSLRSDKKTVTLNEVFDCADIQEFVVYYAKKQLQSLQRGSVTGFLSENIHIKNLNAVNATQERDLDRIFQIRHLYSHRNGIIDEKFLTHYQGQFAVNAEHQMSIQEFIQKLDYLAEAVDRLDRAAINKFQLAHDV